MYVLYLDKEGNEAEREAARTGGESQPLPAPPALPAPFPGPVHPQSSSWPPIPPVKVHRAHLQKLKVG